MTVEQAERALKVGEGVTAGDLYQHFKGEVYEVLGVAIHTETREELIVYQSLETGKTWMSRKEMFFGKTDTGLPRFAKVGENGKLTTNDAWLERDVYPISKAGVEELQVAKCPYCKKYLTTPYMYYFNDYPYCPSCGKRVGGKPTVEPHEIKRERFVVMRKNRTEIWAGLSKNFSFRKLDDLKEVAIKTYRSERQAETCSSWDRDFEVVPVTEIIRFKVGEKYDKT